MYQALHAHDREKRPQPTCKKHRSKKRLKNKLVSMTKRDKEEYFENRRKDFLKRKEGRKMANTHTLKSHKEEPLPIKERSIQKKKQNKLSIQKTPPDIEMIIQKNYSTQHRRLKRRILKIIHYAERRGTNCIIVVKKLFSDLGLPFSKKTIRVKTITMQLFCAGVKDIPVSKYQKMVLGL